jgi:lysophospholipase L1-like esterase
MMPRLWDASRAFRVCVRVLLVFSTVLAVGAGLFYSGNRLMSARSFTMDEGRMMWLSGAGPLFASAGPAESGLGDRMVVADEYADSTRRPEFAARKEPGTYRIFCIGGSTTAGWPFHTLSYPKLLSLQLKDVLPGRRVEVINAGFEASDSASDRRLVRQVLDFDPDLLLIYEGRNDRWNLPLHQGWRGSALKLHCRMLLASNVYARLARLAAGKAGVQDFDQAARRWMETSGGTSESSVRSSLLRNLASMTAAARRRGCKVMLLTQAVSPEELTVNPEIFSINSWIREFASTAGWPVADVEEEFRARWAHAERLVIPTPTVHPDLEGYGLIARTVARALANGDVIAPRREWRLDRTRSDAEYLRILGVGDAELNQIYSDLGAFFIERGLPDVGSRYLRRVKPPKRISGPPS